MTEGYDVKQYYEEGPLSLPDDDARPVSAGERQLLFGALLLGCIFSRLWHGQGTAVELTVGYGTFWLTYLALFGLFCKARWAARREGRILAFAAVILILLNALQPWFGSSDGLHGLGLLNLFAIPFLLMLQAQLTAWPIPREGEAGSWFRLWFYGFFVQPFSSFPACLRAVGSLFRGKRESRGGIWLGVAVAIPVAGVVLALLMGADAVMGTLLTRFTRSLRLGNSIGWALTACIVALLFYSFLWRMAFGKAPAFLASRRIPPRLSPTPLYVVAGTLLAVYALFTYVQFVYLFGGAGLPEGLTYSEYAREGFAQLIWVAAINFSIFAFCLVRVKETPLLKGFGLGLLIATAVILVSAFLRIFLYIGAYGLTLLRVMVVWFLIYLTAVLALSAIRLKKPDFPALRLCAFGFVFWYLVLNAVDLMGLYVS